MQGQDLSTVLLFQNFRVIFLLNSGQFLPDFGQKAMVGNEEAVLVLLDDSGDDILETTDDLVEQANLQRPVCLSQP